LVPPALEETKKVTMVMTMPIRAAQPSYGESAEVFEDSWECGVDVGGTLYASASCAPFLQTMGYGKQVMITHHKADCHLGEYPHTSLWNDDRRIEVHDPSSRSEGQDKVPLIVICQRDHSPGEDRRCNLPVSLLGEKMRSIGVKAGRLLFDVVTFGLAFDERDGELAAACDEEDLSISDVIESKGVCHESDPTR
jgi:hypothetical protein